MSEAAGISITNKTDALAHQRLSADADPHHVIADVLEELLIPDPVSVAETIVRRLKDAGFVIWPYEPPKPPKP